MKNSLMILPLLLFIACENKSEFSQLGSPSYVTSESGEMGNVILTPSEKDPSNLPQDPKEDEVSQIPEAPKAEDEGADNLEEKEEQAVALENCTRGQGYWGSSPKGQAKLIALISSEGMKLGNASYSASELDDIFDVPVIGNALVNLTHQLIAAKMNILNGSDSSQIKIEIDLADSLIGDLKSSVPHPDKVDSASELGRKMLKVKDKLDLFNNGKLNVAACK